jgi:hypothetical protein
MEDFKLFASPKNPKALHKALQDKLDAIEDWAWKNIASLRVQKCWLFPLTRLTFPRVAMQSTHEVTYLGIKFAVLCAEFSHAVSA